MSDILRLHGEYLRVIWEKERDIHVYIYTYIQSS